MRVALYLRVSTSSQTVENQERELRAVAAAARAHRVIDCPIGCVEHLHRAALDRTKLTVD